VIKLKRKSRDILKLVDMLILISYIDEKSGITESTILLRKILKETYFNISLLDYFS
jgi:hypothetical protein